MIPKL